MTKKRAPAPLILLALLLFVGAEGAAAPLPYAFEGAPRIVAVGDVHGAYTNFVAVLRSAGLVDEKLHWTGGKAHLVQLGDVVDRGAESRRCLDLLMRLEVEAERAGGRVHALIGNHEAFNVLGILDYVSREEFSSYVEDPKRVRSEAELRYPAGFLEHRKAFGPEGRYGRWIRGHNAAVRINGIVFSHGDWTESAAALGLEAVNEAVREELSGKRPLEGGLVLNAEGPLQHRGLARPALEKDQASLRAEVNLILAHLGATRLVAGHTVTRGFIEPLYAGKYVGIDTGMLEIYRGGHRVALEIEGDTWRAIHPKGTTILPLESYPAGFSTYLAAAAAADPGNAGVRAALEGVSGEGLPSSAEKARN